jgi:FG-GAP-like repeat
MLFSLRHLLITVAVLVMVVLPLTSSAYVDDVARDFKPLAGIVIMPVQGEFLIDLDASRGVAIGDLFAVVQPGEKVVHPITKEVIGSLDEVKGLLQVTRVKSGYSYAKPLGQATGIVTKDVIRRYENMPAVFWDYTEDGQSVFAELKQVLPTLEWQEYTSTQTAKPETPAAASGAVALTFVLKAGTLEVRDPAFNVLRSYPVNAAQPPPLPYISTPTTPVNTYVAPAPVPMSTPSGAAIVVTPTPAASAVVGSFSPAIIRQNLKEAQRGVWVSPAAKEALIGVEVGDMDGDGRQECALLYAHRIEIVRLVGGAYENIANVDLGTARKGLAIDGADLDGNGVMELYVTAAFDQTLSSMIINRSPSGFEVQKKNINYYFRNMDLPGEGKVLLAQGMGDLHQDFSGPIFRVQLSQGEIQQGAVVDVPSPVRLYSFAPLTATRSGGQSIAYLSILDNLQIYSTAGEKLWESSDRFGGSEEFITRIDPTKAPQDGDNTRNAYMQARLGLGDAGEILIPVNEGDWFRARGKTFRKSRLVAMVWNGQELLEAWHTRDQQGYLADYRLADVDNDGHKEIVMAIDGATTGLMGNRRSSLYVFELE